MKNTFAMLLLAGLALPLAAADTKMSLEGHASIMSANADLKKMADKGTGFTLGGAFTINPAPEYGFRLHVSLNSIKGKVGTGLDNSTFRTAVAIDALRVAGKATFYMGIVGVKWGQDEAKATLREYTDWYRATPTSNPTNVNNLGKGTKLGFRVGVEYDVMQNLAATASFTQSEFNKFYQPSWFNVGVRYRFGL